MERESNNEFVDVSWLDAEWRIDGSVSGVTVRASNVYLHIEPADVSRLTIRRRFWGFGRAEFFLPDGLRKIPLPRLSRGDQRELKNFFSVFVPCRDAQMWRWSIDETIKRARTDLRWVDSETIEGLRATRPSSASLQGSGYDWGGSALKVLGIDLTDTFAAVNEWVVQREFDVRRSFFDSIEKSPLTEEQARAVISYDNRVQVVAAAGSGKTSVMVARAAYAVEKGFAKPDEILLLAFNRDAAEELQTRVGERLSLAGISASGIKASTFHALGLRAIGRARGKKPSLAPWVGNDKAEIEVLSEIVDGLIDGSDEFRDLWHLYRLIYAPMPVSSPDEGRPDAPGKDGDRLYGTFAGSKVKVKSEGERAIANWLYANHVEFLYEAPYVLDTADEEHSQYTPDFFYPSPDHPAPAGYPDRSDESWQDCLRNGTWHEHWGVDQNGKPPAHWRGYEDGMKWKRSLHAENETDLIERVCCTIR